MLAVLFTGPGRIEVAEVDRPEPAADEVLIGVAAVGLCGTDLHILAGEHLNKGWPVIPGHEFAGTIVAVGPGISESFVGRRVAADPNIFCGHCRYCRIGRGNQCENLAAIGVTRPGAAAELVAVPAGNCYLLPDHVETADAALIEPLSCVVRGLDVLHMPLASHVLVYGAGTMGLMMAVSVARAGAASVSIVEPHPTRRQRAAGMGSFAVAASAGELTGRGWDIVIDCTGVTAAIEDGITHVGRGGTFLQFGVSRPGERVSIDPYRIYSHEITITGSMAVLHSFERAGDLFSAGAINPSSFISHRFALEDYSAALDTFRDGLGLKILVQPQRLPSSH
jgi:2-desacetyl-2-hydroxyethyl bacteriochlorophyllide A dehydrogenase